MFRFNNMDSQAIAARMDDGAFDKTNGLRVN